MVYTSDMDTGFTSLSLYFVLCQNPVFWLWLRHLFKLEVKHVFCITPLSLSSHPTFPLSPYTFWNVVVLIFQGEMKIIFRVKNTVDVWLPPISCNLTINEQYSIICFYIMPTIERRLSASVWTILSQCVCRLVCFPEGLTRTVVIFSCTFLLSHLYDIDYWWDSQLDVWVALLIVNRF